MRYFIRDKMNQKIEPTKQQKKLLKALAKSSAQLSKLREKIASDMKQLGETGFDDYNGTNLQLRHSNGSNVWSWLTEGLSKIQRGDYLLSSIQNISEALNKVEEA